MSWRRRRLTTRQHIIDLLRSRPEANPTAISRALDDLGISRSPDEVIAELLEIRRSIDDPIYVRPPECRECGFNAFKHKINIPTRCPSCKSTYIEEPAFTIRTTES